MQLATATSPWSGDSSHWGHCSSRMWSGCSHDLGLTLHSPLPVAHHWLPVQEGWLPVHFAAQYGATAVLNALLAADPASAVASNSFGFTPLHFAAQEGHFGCVQVLLRYEAHPNMKNQHGGTPLHYAAICGRSDVYALLVSAGADQDMEDLAGETPRSILSA
eukprot:m.105808 g.105808  ORF g.105808 m.105808 type:complete len:162 (-) comp9159_c0_seq2:1802-2287(-)